MAPSSVAGAAEESNREAMEGQAGAGSSSTQHSA
jgi:hypothetical protein